MNRKKKLIIWSFFLAMMVSGIEAEGKELHFTPLGSDEVLEGDVHIGTTQMVTIYRKSSGGRKEIAELGLRADTEVQLFANNKKALVLVDDGLRDNGEDDLWFVDGTAGIAKILVKSSIIYQIDDTGDLLCYWDYGYNVRMKPGKATTHIVLFRISTNSIVKDYFLRGYYSEFWGYKLNDQSKEDLPRIKYDGKTKSFTFKMVNSDAFVEQFMLNTKTLELKKTATSTKKVMLL